MSLLLDRVVDVYRLRKDVTNANKESYTLYTPLSPTAMNWQPGTTEDSVVAGGVFGQAYVGFTTVSGILEGDKLITRVTNEVMIVRGKQNWMSPDNLPHIELLLTEFETSE